MKEYENFQKVANIDYASVNIVKLFAEKNYKKQENTMNR